MVRNIYECSNTLYFFLNVKFSIVKNHYYDDYSEQTH